MLFTVIKDHHWENSLAEILGECEDIHGMLYVKSLNCGLSEQDSIRSTNAQINALLSIFIEKAQYKY